MKAFHFAGLFIFVFQTMGCMENQKQMPIIACHLDLVSQNANTSKLILRAIANLGGLISVKSWWDKPKLLLMAKDAYTIANEAEKIATTTTGSTNVVKKLLTYLQTRYGDFYETKFDAWCDLSVSPEVKTEFINLLNLLPQNNIVSIAICSHDPIEHAIYRKKLEAQGVNLKTLFTTIIGIPSIESKRTAAAQMTALMGAIHARLGMHSPLKNLPLPVFKKIYHETVKQAALPDNFDNFVVAPNPYPSQEFIETLKETARKAQPKGSIFIIDPEPARIALLKPEPGITIAAVASVPQLIPTLTDGK